MKTIFKQFVHFFVPTEENNYRSRSLQTNMLTVYLMIAVLLVFVSKKTSFFSQVLGVATDISVEKLLTLTNEERTKNSLSSLTINNQLSDAAQKKASHMFQNNYWAHFSPDGTSPWDFIKQSGYSYEYAGENLAKNFLFSQNVVDAWMDSPTHRANLLNKEYKEVGFAVVNGVLNGEDTTLVVQMFGSPINKIVEKPSVPEKQIQNEVKNIAPEKVLGEYQKNTVPVNGKKFAYDINIFFVFFIFIALIIDFIFASKLNILHLRGKHIAHMIFIGFIGIGILFILRQGAIL